LEINNMKKKLIFGIFVLSVLFFSTNTVAAGPLTSWGAGVVDGAVYTWTITELDADGSTSYTWAFAENMSLSEGDTIEITVGDMGTGLVDPGTTNTIDYDFSLSVGGTAVTGDGATALFWLICPVFMLDPIGGNQSGFIGMERTFFNSFIGGQYDWNFAANGSTARMDMIGNNSEAGDLVECWITAQDAVTWENTELYAFDVDYDAGSGVAQKVTYPSNIAQEPLEVATDYWPVGTLIPVKANSTNNGLTEGLDALVIDYASGDLGPALYQADPVPPAPAVPGFEAIAVLGFMITAAVFVRRRR
jgi:hypothetical protein